MNNLYIFLIFLCPLNVWSQSEKTGVANNQNKTKRTLTDVRNLGEKPVVLYVDSATSPSEHKNFHAQPKAFTIPTSQVRLVFEPDSPKQVAAQQVLYEFQQTPHNAVSNVHVKQLFQPVNPNSEESTGPVMFSHQHNPTANTQQYDSPGIATANQLTYNPQISSAETIVNPVHHSSLVNHGQNYAQVQFQPYLGAHHHQHVQQHIPGKYLYVNGRYIYPPQNQFQPSLKPPQRPNPIIYGQHPAVPKPKLTPPPTALPHIYGRFQPPQKHEIQQITKPIQQPNKEQEVEVEEKENDGDDEERGSFKENKDREESGEDEGYDEDEENDESEDDFGRYSIDEEDEDDNESYREESEEDEDSRRGSSHSVKVKANKPSKKQSGSDNSSKYDTGKNYKYSTSYSSSSKYGKPAKKSHKSKKTRSRRPKTHKKERGRSDRLVGKQTENVPVYHKQKVFREHWFVSKSKNGE